MTNSSYIFDVMKNWKPLPNWRKKREDGEFLLLSDCNLTIHYLNSTARDIVELIGNRTIQEICESMMEIYEVEENVIRRDVINTIRDLQWKHLIRISR